jgi:hypothetical protein
MRGFRLNGWQRIGIVLSVVWALSISTWFFQHIPEMNDPGIAAGVMLAAMASALVAFLALRQ